MVEWASGVFQEILNCEIYSIFGIIASFLARISVISVFKAVYIDKRELKCACVGGDSKVPLGFVSLTENLMMVGMAIWMLSKL